MSRIAKHKVHAALEQVAQHILDATGDDPFVSRKDIRAKLVELEGVEQQLTRIFYRLIDRRDAKPGARVTQKDVADTLAYAKEKLVDAYDINNNGLSAAEIAQMELNAELVVLSACNTGQGRITGDGVVGLSRSLILAGVPSVVVSLWAVPDQPTGALMTEFYQQLEQTDNKAIALRQAMLKVREKYPEPIAWAGFTLIGESK